MKKIPLTQGKFALVDDEDFDHLNQWKWYVHFSRGLFYAQRSAKRENGKQKTIHMHRLVNKTPEGFHTDHINGDSLDNRSANLRTATCSENSKNRGRNNNCSTTNKGVSWSDKKGKFYAQAMINLKKYHLGYFSSEKEAATAYEVFSSKNHGEFYYKKGVSK